MGIEDLLYKAHHKDITEHGTVIQDALEGARLELLAKHYAASLPGDKRNEFEKLTEFEKGVRLGKNDYKLPHDYAESFVMDVVHRVLQGAAPTKAKLMEKQMKILKDSKSTPEQKADAHREVDHFLAIANSYGIRLDVLEKGKVQGFSPNLFKEAVESYGSTYIAKEKSYWLKQINNDMADKYIIDIKKHPELKGFDEKRALDNPYVENKRQLIVNHYLAKKQEKEGAFGIFKKNFEDYFKKPEKKPDATAEKKE